MKVFISEAIEEDYYMNVVDVVMIAANNKIEAYNILSQAYDEKSYEDAIAYYDSPEYREASKPKREYFKSDIKYQHRLAKWEEDNDAFHIAELKEAFVKSVENMFRIADFEVDGEPRMIFHGHYA